MLADVCVEYGYEVSLYRHSAFFTIILVFFLCHCPAFLVYVIVRFFLFMSFPDALLFQSLPAVLKGRRVLLLDDVMTTGSTLRECAKAILKAGAVSVDALTVARVIK